jgi:hypothetical protein
MIYEVLRMTSVDPACTVFLDQFVVNTALDS